MILFANAGAAFMFLAGCGMLIYFLMRKAHMQREFERKSRVVTDVHTLPRQQKTWQTSDNGVVEMAEVARDLNGQLTTKMIVLEQLIADSQKQIERMEKLLEQVEATKRN